MAATLAPRWRLSARSYLLGLISVAVVPVWLFAAYLLGSFALREEEKFRVSAELLAYQVSQVIDGELDELRVVIQALAKSAAMEDGDFAATHAAAKRLTAGSDMTILLRQIDTTTQVLNTDFAFGSELPPAIGLGAVEKATLADGRALVSDLYKSPVDGQPRVAVAITAAGKDGQNYMLAATIPTKRIFEVLGPAVPDGWIVGVADRQGVYVTRSIRHDEVSGEPGLPDYLNKAVGRSGTFEASGLDGLNLLAGYYRSNLSGWLVAANIPLSTVRAPLWTSLLSIGIVGLCAMALSLLLAYLVGRGLTVETARLTERAIALGDQKALPPLDTRLEEYAVVDEALRRTDIALRSRTDELRAVVEVAPVAVWFTYDPAARQVIRNRFAAELMGLPGDDPSAFGVATQVVDTVAYKDGEIVTRDDRPLSRAMRGEQTDHQEFIYVLPSGEKRHLLSSARTIRAADGTILGAVQTSLDITERIQAEESRKLLAQEMSHRVKNSMAVVQALAQQTLKNATSLPEAATTLAARLAALARANEILTREEAQPGDLRAIIEAAVAPQIGDHQLVVEGPPVTLQSSMVVTMTLALHELATNAVKYGAMSAPAGQVHVSWVLKKKEGRKVVELTWRETGGPRVSPPTQTGFGSRLLERAIAGSGGKATVEYPAEGLVCRLTVPV